MGNTILDRIYELREGQSLFADKTNSNRYRIVAEEQDGSKMAYCFSTPIYNSKTGKLLDMSFYRDGAVHRGVGSNAEILVSDHITLKNGDGECSVYLPGGVMLQHSDKYCVYAKGCTVSRTTNGVMLKMRCDGEACTFTLNTDRTFSEVRSNNKYFALMREALRPFVTVSCIGGADGAGNIIAPVLLEYKEDSSGYVLSFVTGSPFVRFVCVEINLYEPKLFQDTTVESNYADSNNVFGGSAFIGETAAFGQQWLYSRPELSKIPDSTGKQVENVILHMPSLNKGVELSAFRIELRFCSIGSTWNNKIRETEKFAQSSQRGSFQSLHLTDLMVDRRTGQMRPSDGFVLKSSVKGGFAAVSTADSCFAPQILEIKYKI